MPSNSGQPLWGIDLGGTKIEGVVLDGDLKPIHRERIPTEAERGYSHIIGNIDRLVTIITEKSALQRPRRIGIGTPGRIETRSGLLKNSNTVALNGRPLEADLEQVLGMELHVENDANCFALAESLLGAGRRLTVQPGRTIFGIILGTGVGGGIVTGGTLLHGAHGIAGEWGHNPLLEAGDACYCGRRGCVESVISGPALERFYAEQSGRRASMEEIVNRCDHDRHARATIDRLVFHFGKALAVVINILDPDMVIVGGGVGNTGQLYTAGAREAIERHLFNSSLDIPLLPPLLGDSAGVFGAALLCNSVK